MCSTPGPGGPRPLCHCTEAHREARFPESVSEQPSECDRHVRGSCCPPHVLQQQSLHPAPLAEDPDGDQPLRSLEWASLSPRSLGRLRSLVRPVALGQAQPTPGVRPSGGKAGARNHARGCPGREAGRRWCSPSLSSHCPATLLEVGHVTRPHATSGPPALGLLPGLVPHLRHVWRPCCGLAALPSNALAPAAGTWPAPTSPSAVAARVDINRCTSACSLLQRCPVAVWGCGDDPVWYPVIVIGPLTMVVQKPPCPDTPARTAACIKGGE